jgi:hypothetical protein
LQPASVIPEEEAPEAPVAAPELPVAAPEPPVAPLVVPEAPVVAPLVVPEPPVVAPLVVPEPPLPPLVEPLLGVGLPLLLLPQEAAKMPVAAMSATPARPN